jgi:putative hydrolase of HD superfamily
MGALAATIQFVLEIDKLKGVLRKVRPVGEDRYENTAEHSWQIALFAMSLARTLKLPLDVNRTVAMLLIHDVGEIDAGDKFVFAQDGWEERKARRVESGRANHRTCATRDCRIFARFMDGIRYRGDHGSPLRESYRPLHACPFESQ